MVEFANSMYTYPFFVYPIHLLQSNIQVHHLARCCSLASTLIITLCRREEKMCCESRTDSEECMQLQGTCFFRYVKNLRP